MYLIFYYYDHIVLLPILLYFALAIYYFDPLTI